MISAYPEELLTATRKRSQLPSTFVHSEFAKKWSGKTKLPQGRVLLKGNKGIRAVDLATRAATKKHSQFPRKISKEHTHYLRRERSLSRSCTPSCELWGKEPKTCGQKPNWLMHGQLFDARAEQKIGSVEQREARRGNASARCIAHAQKAIASSNVTTRLIV